MESMKLVLLLLLGGLPQDEPPRSDLLVADFEGKTFGEWEAEGTAFGDGPTVAAGSVSGFLGDRIASSDGGAGALTSPPFTLDRRYLNLLIGGSSHPGAEVRLILQGRTLRTATPPDEEVLMWQSWDVADLSGREVILRIVDAGRAGESPLKVDHIVQSDQARVEDSVGVPPGLVAWRAHVHSPERRLLVGEVSWVESGKLRVMFKTGDEPYRVETIEIEEGTDILVRGVKSGLDDLRVGDEVQLTLDENRRVRRIQTGVVALDERVIPAGNLQPDYAGPVVNAFKDGRTWLVTVRISKRTSLSDVPFYLQTHTKSEWFGVRRRSRFPRKGMVAFVWLKADGELERVSFATDAFVRSGK